MMRFEKPEGKQNGFSYIINILCIMLIAFILVYGINTFVLMRIEVYGASMEDTLHEGDTRLVLRTKNVKVDDIIVFYWHDPDYMPDNLIKRVIAVEGETVTRDGYVIKVQSVDGTERIAHTGFAGSWGTTAEAEFGNSVTIPTGYLFVMGDNINISYDSTEFGAVPISAVIGRVI